MLYFIFTVDGDWKEYFDINLSEDRRLPQVEVMQELINREIELATGYLEGRFIHFIHTSPRVSNFFLKEPFVSLWKKIIENGGDVGLHCHEDDPYKEYYFQDTARMKKVISQRVGIMRSLGLPALAYRGGFLAFCSGLIPILEENGLYFDFSCEPGRYLVDNDKLVSDWRDAPAYAYRMSYQDHRKVGDSKVYEIPIGISHGHYLYFGKSDARTIRQVASDLKEKSIKDNCDIIVSVLTHSYEYIGLADIKSIKEKIILLKKYGRFINLKDLQKKIPA